MSEEDDKPIQRLPTFDELDAMTPEQKAKLTGRAKSINNLKRTKKGQVRNKVGTNQYTLQNALNAYRTEKAVKVLSAIDDMTPRIVAAAYDLLDCPDYKVRAKMVDMLLKIVVPPHTTRHANADGSNIQPAVVTFNVPVVSMETTHEFEKMEEIESIPAQIIEEIVKKD